MNIQILHITETKNHIPGYAKIRDEKGMRCYVPLEKGKLPILDSRFKTASDASNETGRLAIAYKERLLAELEAVKDLKAPSA